MKIPSIGWIRFARFLYSKFNMFPFPYSIFRKNSLWSAQTQAGRRESRKTRVGGHWFKYTSYWVSNIHIYYLISNVDIVSIAHLLNYLFTLGGTYLYLLYTLNYNIILYYLFCFTKIFCFVHWESFTMEPGSLWYNLDLLVFQHFFYFWQYSMFQADFNFSCWNVTILFYKEPLIRQRY